MTLQWDFHGTTMALPWHFHGSMEKGRKKWYWCFYLYWSTDSVFHECKIFLKSLVLKLHLCEGKGWPICELYLCMRDRFAEGRIMFFFFLFMFKEKEKEEKLVALASRNRNVNMWWLGKEGYGLDSLGWVGLAGQTEGCSDR